MKKGFIFGGFQKGKSFQALTCDLCGSRKGVVESANFVYLCSDCLESLEGKPPYIRQTIERFLIGNVC